MQGGRHPVRTKRMDRLYRLRRADAYLVLDPLVVDDGMGFFVDVVGNGVSLGEVRSSSCGQVSDLKLILGDGPGFEVY